MTDLKSNNIKLNARITECICCGTCCKKGGPCFHLADKHLIDKLKAEVEGILAWLVSACLEWQDKGLGLPAAVQDASESWKDESDPLQSFLDDCCVTGLHCQATAADLYRAYHGWAKDAGLPERARLTHTAFGRRMGERFRRTRESGHRRRVAYQGVGILAEEAMQPETTR